jgi:hypothetical protein
MSTALQWCAVAFSAFSAILWAWSGKGGVPDNVDTIAATLQRQCQLSKWAAWAMTAATALQALALLTSAPR